MINITKTREICLVFHEEIWMRLHLSVILHETRWSTTHNTFLFLTFNTCYANISLDFTSESDLSSLALSSDGSDRLKLCWPMSADVKRCETMKNTRQNDAIQAARLIKPQTRWRHKGDLMSESIIKTHSTAIRNHTL